MRIEVFVDTEETIDNLTFASAIVRLCEQQNDLNAVKVANAILVEMVGEE